MHRQIRQGDLVAIANTTTEAAAARRYLVQKCETVDGVTRVEMVCVTAPLMGMVVTNLDARKLLFIEHRDYSGPRD